MATSSGDSPPSPVRTVDELLICPVCLECFREPKTLNCLHTFCCICLENCKRPYRRDIVCPVCKKITALSPQGVQGLQSDFRIQQIRDILFSQSSPLRSPSPDAGSTSSSLSTHGSGNKICNLCHLQQRKINASYHCTQCCMYFCKSCLEKHDTNTLFNSHHVIDMSSTNAEANLYCKVHKDYSVRYFCQPCGTMLCTVCTMEHNPDHTPVPLEKGMIEKYQQELQYSLKTISSKLAEVKARSKYLETIKQSHQKALFEAQQLIRDTTDNVVARIRDQEQKLLQQVHNQMEGKMRDIGLENLGDMNFRRAKMESLHSDVQSAIFGSPQHCLSIYEDLMSRTKSELDAALPQFQAPGVTSIVKFVPNDIVPVDFLLGQLQECSITDDEFQLEPGSSPQRSSPSYASFLTSTPPRSVLKASRMSSIIKELSSSRKPQTRSLKIGKVKALNTMGEKTRVSSSVADDELLGSASGSRDDPIPSTSGASVGTSLSTLSPLSPNPPSPSDDSGTLQVRSKPQLLFKIDQVGGWPGKITSPTGVDFLPDGNIIVAECENRLQIFDRAGNSVRIIGWGKMKPQGVAVTRNGRIAVTDKKDKCVKIYSVEGELLTAWGVGTFSLPAGIAVTPSGNFVITDVDKHLISLHSPDGTILTQFGCWGSGNYQFNSPSYVAVDQSEKIIVSDSCNSCVKIFDQGGKFLRKISFDGTSQGQLRRPQGVSIDQQGNILVADRDSHRISMFNMEGQFLRHVLGRTEVKYPYDIKTNCDGHVIVVESHNGFLTKDPHHAVKMFQVYSQTG